MWLLFLDYRINCQWNYLIVCKKYLNFNAVSYEFYDYIGGNLIDELYRNWYSIDVRSVKLSVSNLKMTCKLRTVKAYLR